MTSRQKKKKTPQTARRSTNKPKRRWTLGHLLTAFFLGAILGLLVGYESGSVGSQSDGTGTDSYGRSPGDPHYMHNHP
ncbi:hypothetical protein ACXYTJ_08010 [Gilvimarinus sp. F26214L]|uniref:hypothetical protein n=1 Tax=Gilvimarinus sp. DZF01 TaxID=3461371 RepID=UPI0040459DED